MHRRARRAIRPRTVVVGSHLDSVLAGPGINDDGSGTAQDLAIAEQLPKVLKKPNNRVRFAFWGAEESGLLGLDALRREPDGRRSATRSWPS